MSTVSSGHNRLLAFSSPVRHAHQVFRAVLGAMSRPTLAHQVAVTLAPPEPMSSVAGALALALCDSQSPYWLDPLLRSNNDVEAWIGFHTGADIVDDPADALFVFAASPSTAPALRELAEGTDLDPHLSATLVIGASAAQPTGSFTVSGPGVKGTHDWDGAGLPESFIDQWQVNRTLFPRGVDLVIAHADSVVCLPRTTDLKERS